MIQQTIIYFPVKIFINIKNRPNLAPCFLIIFPHRIHRNFCRTLIGKHEYPRGDAAEGDALKMVFFGRLQAGPIAGGQKPLMLRCQRAIHNWPYGVDDITARQAVGRRYLGLPRRFWVSLLLHDAVAAESQANTGLGTDDVINTAMQRLVTAGHPAVRRIDDRVNV